MSSETDIAVESAWPPTPKGPRLAEEDVHVWAVSLDQSAGHVSKLAAQLSPDEQARVNRFHFERDRMRFIVARGSMRALLGRYLRVPPAELEFDYSARGKPSLARAHGLPTLHFNLAHSGGLALLTVTRVGELGVDVEQVRPVQDAEAIAQRFFSPRESAILRSLAPVEMQAAFFNLWTRKEAWLKATGEGIGDSLNQVEVPCLPHETVRFISLFGDPQAADKWRLLHLRPADGYVGALAISAPTVEVHCWRFNSAESDFHQ